MTEPSPSIMTLDNDWPGRALPVMPGDLSKWLGGEALAAGEERVQEDDRLLVVPGTGPIFAAPASIPGGGVIYFDDPDAWVELRAALELMDVYLKTKSYAVFWGASLDSMEDRYLHQVRILTHAALGHIFKAKPEAKALSDQRIHLGAYIEAFIAEQQAKWNDGSSYSRWLDGTLGGDADSAREKLGFGFAVESPYFGVYRLWSRPWLCSK